MTIRKLGQALVPEIDGVARKRWIVKVRKPNGITVDWPSGEPDPEKAIAEALRATVEYAHSYRAVNPLPVVPVAGPHPSVTADGYLRLVVITAANLELPGEVQVHLLGFGGARDTSMENTDDPSDFAEPDEWN